MDKVKDDWQGSHIEGRQYSSESPVQRRSDFRRVMGRKSIDVGGVDRDDLLSKRPYCFSFVRLFVRSFVRSHFVHSSIRSLDGQSQVSDDHQ